MAPKGRFSHRGEHTSHIRRELGRGVVGHGVEIVNVRQREICRLWNRQRLAALLLAGCGGERQDLLRGTTSYASKHSNPCTDQIECLISTGVKLRSTKSIV